MALELSILFGTLEVKSAQWPLSDEISRRRMRITVRGIFFAVVFLLAFFSQAELWLQLRYAYALAGKETPVQTLKIFAQKAGPNAKVLYLEMEDELLAAAAIYLRDIYGRKDITLYSFSPFAAERQKSGLPVAPLKQEEWPNILEKMDYLYWPHRGYSKIGLELLHTQMIQGLVFSGIQYYLDPFYENVLYPIRNLPPEGAQIWSVNKEKINTVLAMRLANSEP
jgi:hypothetical protein